MQVQKRPVAAFVGVLLFGALLYFAMTELQPLLGEHLFDYGTWYENSLGNGWWRLLWMIGDGTEPFFHKTILGGAFLLLGTVAAYFLDRKRSRFRGIPIAYGMGKIFPAVFGAAFLSHLLAILLFGGLRVENDAWTATFIPYVSVAAAVVLLYGASWPSVLTGGVLGALFTTPIAVVLRSTVLIPLGMPTVIGSVTGMWLGGILSFEICRILPWMKKKELPINELSPAQVKGETALSKYKLLHPNRFFVRRMLADYSEPMFVGNEIAGGALIVGSLLTWALDPLQPYYGTGWFPACVFSQIVTGAVAMFLYWDQWLTHDFFPTFVPVVSVAPAMILCFGPSLPVILISAVLGGVAAPACAKMINDKIPPHWNGMVGSTASMAICSFAVYTVLYCLTAAFPVLAA